MKLEQVLVLGGSGFVGTSLANRLADRGLRVRIPTRRRARAGHLLPLPTVDVIEADVHDDATLERLLDGVDAVVNLVAVLHSPSGKPYGPAFEKAHVALPRRLVAACARQGVRRLVHVSALGAAEDGPSEYLRSKAAGEAAIRAAGRGLEWTIVRPSVIFGPGDRFLNMFAGLLRFIPLLPIGGAGSRLQPVYVEDVAELLAASLNMPEAVGQTWDAAGPRVYTLEQLVEYVGEVSGHRGLVIPLPGPLAMIQAAVMERLQNSPLSHDNLSSLQKDSVVQGDPLPFGAAPTPLEAIAPLYLSAQRRRASFFGAAQHGREF